MLKGGQRGRGTQSTTNFLRVLTSAEVATIFSSVSTSLNQLGTRVLHTKVARSHLVDLVNIVLSSSHSSNRVIIGASLEFRPPFVTHPRYMSGVKHTFILFSAAQRHAAWDICSGNWSAVHDEGGLLAKTGEMRVQSTQSILRPFSQRRGPICVVCLSLNQAIHLFLLLRASRAGFAVDEAINDLPGTQYARGSDQKQGRTAGGKRALTRASDRPAPTGQTPCVPEDGPVPPGARCARMVRTWKQALFLVQPETLLRGPRELFRWFWKRKSKVPARKQRLSPETISLLKEMVANNRLWGAERIRGELLKLDIRVSKRTIQRSMKQLRAISCPWTDLENLPAPSCGRGVGGGGPVIVCR